MAHLSRAASLRGPAGPIALPVAVTAGKRVVLAQPQRARWQPGRRMRAARLP